MAHSHISISAILIVYHEQELIERCLQHLTPYVDEIIVIHDGPCQDSTLDIARKYTSCIFEEPRHGMMEFHLITGLLKAKGKWILRIDADEYLSQDMGHHLRQLSQHPQANAFTFRWPIWDGDKYLSQNWPHKTALFRKSAIQYIEDPHSNYMVPKPIINTSYLLEHRPKYNNYDFQTVFSKHKHWAIIHAKHTKKPLYQKKTYRVPPHKFHWTYLLTHPRFGLRYSFRKHLPEILIGEAFIFGILWIKAVVTRSIAQRLYYQVQISYKIAFYLALRNLLKD